MSQDADVKSTLETRLFTVSGLPDADHRALENTLYTPTVGERWIRVTHFFGNERLRTLPAVSGRLEVSGFTQVDHFIPVDSDTAAFETLMNAIKAAFAPELALSVGGRLLKIRESRRWGGKRDKGWWWDHVDLYWTLSAVNPLT